MFKGNFYRRKPWISRWVSIVLLVCGGWLILAFTPIWVWMSILGAVLIGIAIIIFWGWR